MTKTRPYAGETDLQLIADLFNACEAVDKLGFGVSVSVLRQQLPPVDKAHDLCLWEDADGTLVGFASLQSMRESAEGLEGWVAFRVHPAARSVDLGARIIEWGTARMLQVGQERGVRVKLNTQAREDETYCNALLEKSGFTVASYMLLMALRLDEPLLEPQFPEGFMLRPSLGEKDAKAWVEMRNETFIDTRHPLLWTVEDYRHILAAPFYRPELDSIAIASDGTFAAFCLCRRTMPEENALIGGDEGWVSLLGTRRGFRGMALGRAMLLAGLHRAQGRRC
jgi:mycothiol synthase